jgi:hypothetical protein
MKAIALLLAVAIPVLAVDVNIAWDNPADGTYDGIQLVIESTGGKTNTVEFKPGTTNATINLPRASVQRLYMRAWADVEGNPIDMPARIYSENSNVLIARVPGTPSRLRGRLR